MSWRDLVPESRMIYGFVLTLMLVLLARGIGLHDVREENSAGLLIVIGALGGALGAWSGWAFGRIAEIMKKEP